MDFLLILFGIVKYPLYLYIGNLKTTDMKTKFVYFPILGLIYAFVLFFSGSPTYNSILQEKYAVIYMLLSHILSTEIIVLILLVNLK